MTGKKRIFAGMGILLGVLVGVQGTAAYQSAYDKAVNIVTPGNISSEIGEDFPNPPTIVPDKDIDIAKKIWVSNNPSGTSYTTIAVQLLKFKLRALATMGRRMHVSK